MRSRRVGAAFELREMCLEWSCAHAHELTLILARRLGPLHGVEISRLCRRHESRAIQGRGRRGGSGGVIDKMGLVDMY
jgi:hypothetical protein